MDQEFEKSPDEYLTLAELAEMVKRKYQTVWNWHTRGKLDCDGKYQKLECIKTFKGLCTTKKNFHDWNLRLGGIKNVRQTE